MNKPLEISKDVETTVVGRKRGAPWWLWCCLLLVILLGAGYMATGLVLQFKLRAELRDLPSAALDPAFHVVNASVISRNPPSEEERDAFSRRFAGLLAAADAPEAERSSPIEPELEWFYQEGQLMLGELLAHPIWPKVYFERQPEHLQQLVSLARLIAEDGAEKLERGDASGARRSIRTLSRLTNNALMTEPWLAAHITRLSMISRTVDLLELTVSAYPTANEQAPLVDPQHPTDIVAALGAERAAGHARLVKAVDGLTPVAKFSILRPLTHGLRNDAEHLSFLRGMDRLIETVDRPTEDRLDAFDAVYREVLDHNPLFGAYLKEQAAAFPTAIRLDLLVTARVRCAEVAVWILIHRDVRGGLPDELSEAFDTNTKPDPYTGEPLRYVRFEGGGFSVYSVGVDGYDDGGRRENERGESFGPGADVVFTVLGAEEP